MPLLGAAMIEDLRREADYLAEVVAMATNPVITSLRALDIVAWQAGRSSGPKPGLWSNDVPTSSRTADDGAGGPPVSRRTWTTASDRGSRRHSLRAAVSG